MRPLAPKVTFRTVVNRMAPCKPWKDLLRLQMPHEELRAVVHQAMLQSLLA